MDHFVAYALNLDCADELFVCIFHLLKTFSNIKWRKNYHLWKIRICDMKLFDQQSIYNKLSIYGTIYDYLRF